MGRPVLSAADADGLLLASGAASSGGGSPRRPCWRSSIARGARARTSDAARPRVRLAGLPRARDAGRQPAEQQQREREQPEALDDRQRRPDRDHHEHADDDPEDPHEAGEQPGAHGVERNQHERPGRGTASRPGPSARPRSPAGSRTRPARRRRCGARSRKSLDAGRVATGRSTVASAASAAPPIGRQTAARGSSGRRVRVARRGSTAPRPIPSSPSALASEVANRPTMRSS